MIIGNWTDYVQKTSGTTVLDHQRDHNLVNEIDTDQTHGDADNPITETTGTAWADPVYDAAGNMTTVPRPGSLVNGYTCKYDAWNRLVEVKEGATVVASHEYDGLNRRTIEMPVLGGTTYYLHKFCNASWQMMEMRSTTNGTLPPESCSVSFQYIWSARYLDAPVLRDYAGTRYYYLDDANFNVTCLVDTSGDARERYQYAPYGTVTVLNGAASDSDGAEWTADPNNASDVDNHTLYTGRWLDYRTGLYHNRRRPYHAQLGRFVNRDPIEYQAGDENLYRYTGNCPVRNTDPSGQSAVDLMVKLMGGKVPQAEGISLDAQVALVVGWKQGADVMFFPDTCEIASFTVVQKAFVGARGWTAIDGGVGLGVGVSLTIESAVYLGAGPASAASFTGGFYTVSGGGGPYAAGLYIGAPPSAWRLGGNFGGGVGYPGVTFYYSNMIYTIGLGPKILPRCICYPLIYAM